MSGGPRLTLAGLLPAMLAAAPAHAGTTPPAAGTCALHAPEAARRSGLSLYIILRVMRAESAGNPRAVSAKGAMGCMQIMPATWSYLTNRHGLGTDPFDARMNMIGGALYLAELAARYGFPGAYSAYNAGPGRYERYLAGRAALPGETIAYTVRIRKDGPPPPLARPGPRWREASLFVATRTPTASRIVAPTTRRGEAVLSSDTLFPLAALSDPQTDREVEP